MRVLFLTDSLSDLDGVGRYALRLISAMEAQRPDLEVHVLLARKHRPTSKQVPAHWQVEVALPPDYFFYMTPARYWAWRAIGTFHAWRAARKADIVHAIKDFPHNQIALDAARRAGKPCIATAHGTYTIQPLLDERHGARARKVYQGFARMISVSHYTRRRLLALMGPDELPPERVEVIPNCVDAEHYIEPRRLGHRPWHDGPFSLSIGEVKERKGHHLALAGWCEAAQAHPDWQHFVVGRLSGDPYEVLLRGMVEDAGLGGRVHFLGNIDEEEKIDLLQRAEVFVHTPVTASDGGFEGFGIVYLEASAAGTPALGTLDCGAEDAIVDGETGFLVEQRPAAVAERLAQLMGDAQLRARMGAAGRAHAARSTWEPNAARVLALYDEALDAAGSAGEVTP